LSTPTTAANCIAMPADVAEQVAAARGYVNVRPDYAWEDWQQHLAALEGN